MSSLKARPTSLVDLVEPYVATGSVHGRQRRRRAAVTFLARFDDPKGWERASLDEQLSAQPACGRFVAWLIVTSRVRPSVEYLLACRGRLGAPADIVYPHLSAQFDLMGTELGSPPINTRRHWSALILVATASGHRPDRLSTDIIETTLLGFAEAASRCGQISIRNLSAAVFGMQTVLFHLGLLEAVAPRHNGREGRRAADWDRIAAQAPVLTATMRDYLDQMSVRLRPNSLNSVDTSLRVFAGYLLTDHEDITAVADIRRCHVQAYKTWLASRRGNRGPTLANQTLRERLGALVTFFGRLDELDIADAPGRSPILRLDLPIKDDPLPRFIDDAASAKLLTAVRAHVDQTRHHIAWRIRYDSACSRSGLGCLHVTMVMPVRRRALEPKVPSAQGLSIAKVKGPKGPLGPHVLSSGRGEGQRSS